MSLLNGHNTSKQCLADHNRIRIKYFLHSCFQLLDPSYFQAFALSFPSPSASHHMVWIWGQFSWIRKIVFNQGSKLMSLHLASACSTTRPHCSLQCTVFTDNQMGKQPYHISYMDVNVI